MKTVPMVLLTFALTLSAQEPKVAPTWLHRYVPSLPEWSTDFSFASWHGRYFKIDSCHYTPIFGEGDSDANVLQSVERFGEVTIDPHGYCTVTGYLQQEEVYFVLSGSGILKYEKIAQPIRKNDFFYVPTDIRNSLANSSDQPLRLIRATVKIPPEISTAAPPPKPLVANLDELREQTVEGHPTSVLYKLLIGPRSANRDRINAAYEVADFFLMDFAPGGTNSPHHHEVEEEIYLVLDGEGTMVAGSGPDGVEGLYPAKAGDAYYFRPNCTVGFYNKDAPGAKAHILALRAYVPLPKNPD
jgi:mannose-6-phosphate isomerase-like protein (cupin superfamily)